MHFDAMDKFTTKGGFIKIQEGSVAKKGLHLDCLDECHCRNQSIDDSLELDTPTLGPHTSCAEKCQLSQDHSGPCQQVTTKQVSTKNKDGESIFEKYNLNRQIRIKTIILQRQKKKIRTLQQTVLRLKKKNLFLQNILKELTNNIC